MAREWPVAEREGFEPSIRFCRILTFQASAFDHSATAPHCTGKARRPSDVCGAAQGDAYGAGRDFAVDESSTKRLAPCGSAFPADAQPRRPLALWRGVFSFASLAGTTACMRLLPITLVAAFALALPAAAQAQASAAIASGMVQPSALAPSEIVAAAPAKDWEAIAPSDLLVMILAPDRDGRPRQVVIQLMPAPFSQGWIGNIRKLAAAHWWDRTSINRVQDNYVVQWGDADAEDKAEAKVLPDGLMTIPEADYVQHQAVELFDVLWRQGGWHSASEKMQPVRTQRGPDADFDDAYSASVSFRNGFPFAISSVVRSEGGELRIEAEQAWPVHCYGMVGVGRDLSPDTGSGAELYTVIGHAPRHLDRNIALVGRVIEGIEHLSSLPRGTLPLGFYDVEKGEKRVPIQSIRLATELPATEQPRFEYLSTESDSFARYADARANRRDPFFNVPAGGADICNIPVPVRRAMKH